MLVQSTQLRSEISARGATQIVFFTGILNATRYTDILDAALLPFIENHYPTGHRYHKTKHTSRWAQQYFEKKTGGKLNPIENVWGFMKKFLRTNIKPKTIPELKDGIRQFWLTLTPAVCQKYIKKVVSKEIEENGVGLRVCNM